LRHTSEEYRTDRYIAYIFNWNITFVSLSYTFVDFMYYTTYNFVYFWF